MSLEDLRNLKLDLKSLLQSRGWKALSEILDALIRARRIMIIETRLEGLDDFFILTRSQGELAGLQLVLALPQALVAELESEIAAKEQENAGNA
jgi:hypothetical protein